MHWPAEVCIIRPASLLVRLCLCRSYTQSIFSRKLTQARRLLYDVWLRQLRIDWCWKPKMFCAGVSIVRRFSALGCRGRGARQKVGGYPLPAQRCRRCWTASITRTWGRSIPQLVHKPNHGLLADIADVSTRLLRGILQHRSLRWARPRLLQRIEIKAPCIGKLHCFLRRRVLPWRQLQLSHHLAHKLICSPYTGIPELRIEKIARHQL